MNKVLRTALTGSALATGMMLAASPAQAACVVTPAASPVTGTVVCGTTTTANTTYPVNSATGTDRHYAVNTTAGTVTGTISTGAVVDGFGLAFTDAVGGGNTLSIVNGGTVQVSAGNIATVGGSGALFISTTGTTNLSYSGAGNVLNLGPGVSATGDGLSMIVSGTGNLTAAVGGNLASTGDGSYALWARQTGTAGNISVTTAAGTTIRGEDTGIDAQIENAASAGTLTVVNNAAIGSVATALNTFNDGINANSAGTGAVTVTNNGAIGLATDRAQSDGIEADITNATSAATLRVDGTGAIFSAGDGIDAVNLGTGQTQVIYSGAINSTGGSGIAASSTTGLLTVTSGAITTTGGNAITANSTTGNQVLTNNGVISSNAAGIQGTATTGTITVNVNQNVTAGANGVNIGSAGAQTVNVAAGATLNSTGGNDIAFQGAGTGTVTNLGTIGGDTLGVAIAGPGAGAITITNGSTTNATAAINGRLTLSGSNDTFTNRAVWNTQGTTDFGAGTDTLVNLNAGVINILGATTFANLETFTQTGRINLNNFVLTGSAIPFVNGPGGFIDTSGSASIIGFTSFTNSGTIDLAAGTFTVPTGAFTNTATGIIIADEGATTITGQTSFSNAGVIDLLDGVRDDALTINSSYIGTGAGTSTLQVDVSGTTADTLTINGNVSGQTAIDVNVIGLGVFVPAGILVVDVTGAFTSTADAFVIGEESGNPLINFDVERRGQDFFLVTLLDPETAFVPLAATGLIREMWYQSADEVFAHTLAPTAKLGLSVWGNVYGSQRRTGMTNEQFVNGVQYDADNNIEIDRYGVQAGVGYGFGVAEVGITAGYANAQANGDGEFDADGYNIGLYGRYGGLTGFHAEALFKHDAYDVSFDGLFDGNDVDASSTGVDGSIGYRMAMGVVPSIDFHAGLSHVWSDMDDVSAFGFGYEFDDMTSTRGRLGVRGNFGGLYNPYLSGTAYREFSGDGDVTLTNGAFSSGLSSSGKGTWVRLEGGLAGGQGTYGLNVAGWVDFGDTRGAGIRAGFRF